MKIFDIEAVVKIVTGGSDKALAELEQKGISLDNSMTTNFKNIGAEALRLAGPAILGALGAALASIGATAVKLGTELVDAMHVYQSETGASAAETAIFADQLTNLWQGNTDGIEDLAEAIVAVRRAFGDLGDETEGVTQTMLNFTKVTGGDVKRSTQGAASVLRQYGLELESLPQLLDTLARTQQITGASTDKVLTSLKKSAPIIQSMGLSIQEASAFFAILEMNETGAEAATMSLINIMKSSTATTEAQTEAFKLLGIAVDEAGRPIGGAEAVFNKLIPMIERGEIKGDKLAATFAVMGEGAKELVPALAASRVSMGELSDEVTNSEDTVNRASDTFDHQIGERLPLLFKNAFGDSIKAAAKVGVSAIEWLLDALEWVVQKTKEVGTFSGAVAYGIEASYAATAGTVKDVFNVMVEGVLDSFRYVLDKINAGIESLPVVMQKQLGGVKASLGSFREDLGENNAGTLAEALVGHKDDFVNPFKAGQEALVDMWDEQKKVTESYKELKSEVVKVPPAIDETAKSSEELAKASDEAKRKAEQMAKEQARAAEEAARANEQLRIAIIRQTQGETAAKLAELEIQKRAYQKAGADQLAIDRWYAEESKMIREEARTKEADEQKRMSEEQFSAAQQAARLEADLLEANGNTLAAKLANLEIEKEAFLRTAKDKVKAEELFAKRREEIIKQSAEESAKIEEELALKTMEAKGQTEEAKNMRELARIRETVEAARAAGVEEVKIAEYIAAEQKRIRDGMNAEAKQEEAKSGPTSPLQSFEEAFGGMSGLNFSIGGGKKRSTSDPASNRAANELISQVGQLGNAAPGAEEPLRDELIIKIVNENGEETFVESVSRGGGGESSYSTNYQMGGF